MWIKPLKNGKFCVMPDMKIVETAALAWDYIKSKQK